jgi:DNA-binding MarR family transcriptional regulator
MTLEPRFTRYLREMNRQRQVVSAHPALTPTDKLLWMCLRDEQMSREEGEMKISVVDMAALAGVSPRNVHRSLLALQNAGLLRRSIHPGNGRQRGPCSLEVLVPRRRARVMVREAR